MLKNTVFKILQDFKLLKLSIFISLLFATNASTQNTAYHWMEEYDSTNSITKQLNIPQNYIRIQNEPGGFAEWLHNLPIRTDDSLVHLYNGKLKRNQDAQHSILDIDVGDKNLQQCADAVIRLRAEYLYSKTLYDNISFNFTSGDAAKYSEWIKGYRPAVNGNNVVWNKSAQPDSSYIGFRRYLQTVFTYAGSYSLSREMKKVSIRDIQIGDIFIQGGFPGHAVIVVDIAVNVDTNTKVFLLAQSYMPAQEIHILKNSIDSSLSPWYEIPEDCILITPEWEFEVTDLMRFLTLYPVR